MPLFPARANRNPWGLWSHATTDGPITKSAAAMIAMLATVLVVPVSAMGWWASTAAACPFCGSVQSTMAQDIKGADAAVIAKLIELPKQTPTKDGELNVATPMAKFELQEVLKGPADVQALKTDKDGHPSFVEAPFFDDKPLGGEYMILGTEQQGLAWAPPYALTQRSRKYVSEIVKLPPLGNDRLAYFQNYLEDSEDLLKNDAYYEFALAPYTSLQALKPRMDHQKLAGWVRDPNVLVSHRRLYLTMLGVCGTEQDVPMLEKLLHSDDPRFKTGLDATVACYLTIKGQGGLPLVEKLFLKKQQEEFTDIFSVVMALRFLGQEDHGPISRDRLVQSMRLVLDHPKLADQAIMDLARWKDWTVMDRLVKLFNSPDQETTTWVRIPVINYLRACPLPQAKQYIEQLRKIDPKAVEQSETLYAVGPDPMPNVTTQRADMAKPTSAANQTQGGSSGATSSGTASSGTAAGTTSPAGQPAASKSAGASPSAQTPAASNTYKSSSAVEPSDSARNGTVLAASAPAKAGSATGLSVWADVVVFVCAIAGALALTLINRSRASATHPHD
jgi:hypothetical protein